MNGSIVFKGSAAILLVMLCGCITASVGARPDDVSGIQPGVTNKAGVYDQLGVPTDVFQAGDGYQVLVYTRRIKRGMGAGITIGFSANPLLAIGHNHVGSDSWIIVVDQDGVVKSVDAAEYSDEAKRKLSPF